MTPRYNIGGSNRRDKAFFSSLKLAFDCYIRRSSLGEYRRFLNGNTARKIPQTRPLVSIIGSWPRNDQGYCALIRILIRAALAHPARSFCRVLVQEYLVIDWLILVTARTVPDGKSCVEGFGVS